MLDLVNKKSTREGFGKALEVLATNENIWVVSADLSDSLNLSGFAKIAPERFVECGIQEQNAVTVACGISMSNPKNIAIFGSFAEFLPMRCLDQIRISACMQNLNVKFIGGHSGLSYGGDGESIQCFEDIAVMRSLPNMKVFVPASSNEAYHMTKEMMSIQGPCYLRLNREPDPELFADDKQDCHGLVSNGNDILIIANGSMVAVALESSEKIKSSNGMTTSVYNCSTIKPFPAHEIISLAKQHKYIVTCEEAQVSGGLGSIVAEILCDNFPMKILRIGIEDMFGQSGTVEELRQHYQVDAEGVVSKILKFVK